MMMMVMTVLDLNSRSKRERLTRVVGVASDARVMGIPFCKFLAEKKERFSTRKTLTLLVLNGDTTHCVTVSYILRWASVA
jgi:hypothetical protein